MSNTKRIGRRYLVVGIALSLLSLVFLIIILSNASQPEESTPALALVLIADDEVPAGSFVADILDEGKMTLSMMPLEEVPVGGMILSGDKENEEELTKAVASVIQGASTQNQLYQGDIVRLADLTWTAPIPIPEGMVAIGVGVDGTQSLGGVLQPGDRVNIVAAYEDLVIDEFTGEQMPIKKTRVLRQNVLILDVYGVSLDRNRQGGLEVFDISAPQDPEGLGDVPEDGIPREAGSGGGGLVLVLAVEQDTATRIHYMQTFGAALTLVVSRPQDPLLTNPDIVDEETFRDNAP